MSNSNQQGNILGENDSKATTTNSNLSTTSSWCFCHFTFVAFYFVAASIQETVGGVLFINHAIVPVQHCHNNEIQYNPFVCHLLCVTLLWKSQTLRFVRPSGNGFVRWAMSYLPILQSWPSDIPLSSFANLVKYTRLFLLLFKYRCTLPVHAHKDKLKLCNVLFCVGHQGFVMFFYSCAGEASHKQGSFWVALSWVCTIWEKPVHLADQAKLVFVYSVLTDNWGAHNKCSQ